MFYNIIYHNKFEFIEKYEMSETKKHYKTFENEKKTKKNKNKRKKTENDALKILGDAFFIVTKRHLTQKKHQKTLKNIKRRQLTKI
jgi:hypothetical protein